MRRPQRLTSAECTVVRIPIAIKPEVERLTELYIVEKLRNEAEALEKKLEASK
jgi:hypothetical protein